MKNKKIELGAFKKNFPCVFIFFILLQSFALSDVIYEENFQINSKNIDEVTSFVPLNLYFEKKPNIGHQWSFCEDYGVSARGLTTKNNQYAWGSFRIAKEIDFDANSIFQITYKGLPSQSKKNSFIFVSLKHKHQQCSLIAQINDKGDRLYEIILFGGPNRENSLFQTRIDDVTSTELNEGIEVSTKYNFTTGIVTLFLRQKEIFRGAVKFTDGEEARIPIDDVVGIETIFFHQLPYDDEVPGFIRSIKVEKYHE